MSPTTPLGELARGLATLPDAARDIPIDGVVLDSRKVRPNTLFAALPGARPNSGNDGTRHIADALARGASAILTSDAHTAPLAVPVLHAAEPRQALARIAARHAGPAPDTVVAITGTNGKTSTADFLRQLWTLDHRRAASLGTLGLVSDIALPAALDVPPLTTPDSVTLAGILASLRDHGVDHVALEASSHGLDQFRLDGVRLAAAGFSNLTRDHLDYHHTLDAYRGAKLRLFAELLPEGALACVNADMDADTQGALRALAKKRRLQLRTSGVAGDTLRLIRQVPQPNGQRLELSLHGRTHNVHLGLPGRFQADNVLLACLLSTPDEDALPAMLPKLEQLVGVRGRMERAVTLPGGASAYVDYAHTPDALRRLLESLRPHAAKAGAKAGAQAGAQAGGRLVLVFGAGGDRDRGKRPLMGAVAAELADHIIVTDDNPRSENPAAIRAEIRAACPSSIEIGDRAQAIEAGLEALRPGDVLVVAGKGHEQGQIVGDTTLPFDDAATLRRLAGAA